MKEIGLNQFGFPDLRNTNIDIFALYGIPNLELNESNPNSSSNSDTKNESTNKNKSISDTKNNDKPTKNKTEATYKNKAYSINDQRAVSLALKHFTPCGDHRSKLVALRDEMKNLKVKDNPIAFCFILRSMFEISAAVYSSENKIPTQKEKNNSIHHYSLKEQLKEVTKHLTKDNKDKDMVKAVHGALSELSKTSGILSVTSMNQLVHNKSFSIAPNDIFILFNNVFPLLEAMNQ